MSPKIPCTVGILTRNSAATLERALISVEQCSDIIICDGGSTDETLQIAEKYGARVLQQDKRYLDENGRLFDYGGARNQYLDAAKEEWILALDSDEFCGEDLMDAIKMEIRNDNHSAFWVNRIYMRHGGRIDCASTYPNRQMRFFSKRAVVGYIKKIHERIKIKEGLVPDHISGTLYVPLDMSADELRRKWRYQERVEVQRVGPVTPIQFVSIVLHYAKISLLYAVRYLNILLFCTGTRLPFDLEMERHWQHIRLIGAFWHVIQLRSYPRT